jgi:hypothetical protein
MKTLVVLLFNLLILLPPQSTPALASGEGPVPDGASLVEKRRTIVKVFEVSAKDQLAIDNQFGQVTVNLWDKKDIRVEVVITANAASDARAAEYLNAVSIDEKREGPLITLRTGINRSHFGATTWSAWKSTGSGPADRNYIQIDYTIHMPKTNALVVQNKFGDTHIPTFQAPLTVDSKYGNFHATLLDNPQNVIQVAFGNARIGTMKGGKLEVRFGDLLLDRATTLALVNKSGKLTIGEVDRLNADINYSGASSIGSLNESCEVKLNYSGNFRISQLPRSAEHVDIRAAYSSVTLPAESSNFDVTVTHGNFRYPTNVKVLFTNQPGQEEKAARAGTRSYEGKVGSGTGTRIKVISRFGDVSLKE